MHSLTAKINTYFAMLLITIIGAGATLMIIRVAASAQESVFAGSGAFPGT